ncbi:acyl-CoA thioesterase [Telmatocola sphagniphila]|uniref:Acyl-CoA thioesterase n=1 Tax=Telmatocola sphagniphila TaxID=1123043 RepID=A0A8E6ESX3_9BACT|nr:thioesterase family protein [Telmatocola sphagniphila]QVL31549.1 acyl-CoA thioesterase [Telmatocola sphagniphila]
MSSRFVETIAVQQTDIDVQGHVNNVAFLRLVQDIAVKHWLHVASAELKSAYTWVVRKHEIEYLSPGLPGDELELTTWVGEPSAATWERFTEIKRASDSRLLVKARTLWVLLDAGTGRPRRVDQRFLDSFTASPS